MKKTVWKPTKEELEEIGFIDDVNQSGEKISFIQFKTNGQFSSFQDEIRIGFYNEKSYVRITNYASEGCDAYIYPRSKEELQAFISMFEEDE